MDVPLFLVAEYANKSENGTLNVLGIFNIIKSMQFPARHRLLYLVVRIALEYGEFDVEHDFKILFIDEDGHELGENIGKLKVARPDTGGRVFADLIIQVGDLILEKPGPHEFKFIINREVKGVAPIDVVKIQSENAE